MLVRFGKQRTQAQILEYHLEFGQRRFNRLIKRFRGMNSYSSLQDPRKNLFLFNGSLEDEKRCIHDVRLLWKNSEVGLVVVV